MLRSRVKGGLVQGTWVDRDFLASKVTKEGKSYIVLGEAKM
jgi:hypothetical protein